MNSEIDTGAFRRKVATNFSKWLILGDSHEEGSHQYEMVIAKLNDNDISATLDPRTWESWLSGDARRLESVYMLDEWGQKWIARKKGENNTQFFPSNFFEEMILGGLVQKMLSSTKSKHVQQLLKERAQKYHPVSAYHLHLDALDINTLINSFFDVPWQEITRIAANKIFEILSNRWGPRHGQIYSTLSSSLKLQWESADADERRRIQKSYGRFSPYLFERDFNAGAQPEWHRIGVDSSVAPQHIYKTLFAMAADPDFLVDDRFDAWALDLATAALAMQAFAWTDRYATMGVKVTHEMVFRGAFYFIFFDTVEDRDDRFLYAAMKLCGAEWDDRSVEIFDSAREKYLDMLSKCNISQEEVEHVSQVAQKAHRLVYVGDWEAGNATAEY